MGYGWWRVCIVAAGVVCFLRGEQSGFIPIRMINPQPIKDTIHQGKRVTAAERLEEWMIAPIKTAEKVQAAEQTPQVLQSKQLLPSDIADILRTSVN